MSGRVILGFMQVIIGDLMPVVHVNMWKGISDENARKIISGVTEVFVKLGIPSQAVEVIIREVQRTHRGIGGKPSNEVVKGMGLT